MTRRPSRALSPNQPDLFSLDPGALTDATARHRVPTPTTAPTTAPATAPRTPRTRSRDPGGSPDAALTALHEIAGGQVGIRETTDRFVTITGEDTIRVIADAAPFASLLAQGYATTKGTEPVSCRHGAVTTTVIPVKLTPRGRVLLERWSALKPLT